ncbi:uncharacterized protein METZ01_LOCUS269908, partial [marine metagenome]
QVAPCVPATPNRIFKFRGKPRWISRAISASAEEALFTKFTPMHNFTYHVKSTTCPEHWVIFCLVKPDQTDWLKAGHTVPLRLGVIGTAPLAIEIEGGGSALLESPIIFIRTRR